MEPKKLDQIISEYRSVFRENNGKWDVDLRPRPNLEMHEVEQITAKSLEVLGHGSDSDAFLRQLAPDVSPNELTFQDMLALLAKSLLDDIRQCLKEEERCFLGSIHLSFLDTGLTNACCVNTHANGASLDQFLIFLNEGLYFSLRQLFTALLFEELQGDLAKFRRDGEPAFQAAIRLYLDPKTEHIVPVSEYVGDLEASGEIGAHITSATSLLLQFITLHEFAHAWLGHHEILEEQRLSIATRVIHPANRKTAEISRELEFQADEFAFRALMRRTKTIESQWAHCFAIHLFFGYLAELEKRLGQPLSHLHPRPSERSDRLRQILKREYPSDAHREDDLFRVDAMITKWSKT